MKTNKMVVLLSTMMFIASVFAASALAGSIIDMPVYISGDTAMGSVRSAAESSNTVEYIGCSVGKGVWDFLEVTCSAKDANSITLTCTSTDPIIAEAAGNITPISKIRFTRGTDGTCLYMSVDNSSRFY